MSTLATFNCEEGIAAEIFNISSAKKQKLNQVFFDQMDQNAFNFGTKSFDVVVEEVIEES